MKEMGLEVSVEAVTTHMTAEGEKPIDHDADPTVLLVHYPSIFAGNHSYVKPVVKVEISCLSMRAQAKLPITVASQLLIAKHNNQL